MSQINRYPVSSLFYSRLFPLDAQLCSLELVFWGRVCPRDNRWPDYSHSAPCLQSLCCYCCTFADGILLRVLTHMKWLEFLRKQRFQKYIVKLSSSWLFPRNFLAKVLSKGNCNCWRKSRMPRWVGREERGRGLEPVLILEEMEAELYFILF